MAIGDEYTCRKCGNVWNTVLKEGQPKQCPACGVRLRIFEEVTEDFYECPRCMNLVQLTSNNRFRWHTKLGSSQMCGESGKPISNEKENVNA